ncbi:class I adenylate cyclase [Shewanella maritima]|uniref:class I adenylate cyclase n=1 Tax=Shewanella maritima TaxID=2520507 RepID=UPI0037358145
MPSSSVAQHVEVAEKLNNVRLARVNDVLSETQSCLLKSIPVLFHANSPNLPGYIDSQTPRGICQFVPMQDSLNACKQLLLELPSSQPYQPWAFEGIYAMGSTASFGQNPKSDVDVWLVYRQDLTESELSAISQKAQRLTAWYATFEFEVNFYLIHPQQYIQCDFCSPQQSLGAEHSGSSQHWLLLEEFYRSHIRLAGKPVAWWPDAPQTDEKLLYLGAVEELPAAEYFGASLWQLYKGLQKPHKALLKVLLLEMYAAEYPNNLLLTQQIWRLCLAGNYSDANDAYLLLYQRIEAYLLHKRDVRRLEIVRRCFYLKCGIKLSKKASQSADWRTESMRNMVNTWSWPESLLTTLDQSQHWHSGQLKWFNQQLNELLLASYRTLLKFASKHTLSDTMRVEELGILARKLHAYFSEDEHQLLPLNPLWSEGFAESQLSVISSKNKQAYFLYRRFASKSRLMSESALASADNLCALVAWAAVNQIAMHQTQWQEYGRNRSQAEKLTNLSRILVHNMCRPNVSKRDLCQPCYFKKIIIVANLGLDPTEQWQGQEVMLDYMNATPLALGPAKANMLGDINIICLNSWGEWQSHHFDNQQGILEALSFISVGMKTAKKRADIVTVSCSLKLKSHIEHQLNNIVAECQNLLLQAGSSSTFMYPMQLGKQRYGLYFNSRGMIYKKLESLPYKDFSSYSQPQQFESVLLPRPDLGDDPFSSMPSVILQYITEGAEQYFLRQRDACIDVFLIDEHNGLTYFECHDMTMSELAVAKTSEYVFQAKDDAKRNYFNMPQFFLLKRKDGDLTVVPFGIDDQELGSEF